MFFKSMINVLNSTYNALNTTNPDNIDPNIIKFFRTEYGSEWKSALEQHLYKESLKNDKKAA